MPDLGLNVYSKGTEVALQQAAEGSKATQSLYAKQAEAIFLLSLL